MIQPRPAHPQEFGVVRILGIVWFVGLERGCVERRSNRSPATTTLTAYVRMSNAQTSSVWAFRFLRRRSA